MVVLDWALVPIVMALGVLGDFMGLAAAIGWIVM
jgi:hypothetical protein